MCILDMADRQSQLYLENCIEEAKNKKTYKLYPSGQCHYCYEEVEGKKLFCNSDCAEDYDKELKLRR